MVYDKEGKYGHLFMQDTILPATHTNPEVQARYEKFGKRVHWIDSNNMPGAFQMNTSWWYAPNKELLDRPGTMASKPHSHPFPEILGECETYGNADMVVEFASTSKITFPGAGVSCFACSEANMAYMKKLLDAQIISYDKVNQLRHVRYLKDREGVLALMKKHAEILGPKFRMVLDTLDREIAPLGIARWQHPHGGYFVSVNTMPGVAMATWQLCKDAGLTMTKAGAAFPYGRDPEDSNMRIAPSLPPVEQLEQAMELYCISLRLAALRKLLAD